jgi:tetraacyldisaccharide 4'-kinase
VILDAASAIYGAVAARRRAWYSSHPDRRRRLHQPVVSVGSLRAGGSGKTPVVGHLVDVLRAAGERPSILSRGYAREHAPAGVTVVSDGRTVLAGIRTAGDEPLMLARHHPAVPVLVCPDRYLAGRLAEERLEVTVHVLDDGFQHLRLARDVDLLLADRDDLTERVLPAGRLREPPGSAACADALLTVEAEQPIVDRLRAALGVPTVFRVRRTLGPVTDLATGAVVEPAAARRCLAVAAVARPERFFDDLGRAGWTLAGRIVFSDHHRFTDADLRRVERHARDAGATLVVITAKDAVRWIAAPGAQTPVAVAGLTATLEPAFAPWLAERLARARARADQAGSR